MKNIKLVLIGAGLAVFSAVAPLLAKAETMSTGTLGANIDLVNGTFMDFLGILITKYWPFLLGAVILVAIWAFGKSIIQHFI